jgi:CBS domain-containing protein
MKVKSVMSTEIETVEPHDTLKKAAKIMNKYRISGLVVQKDQEIVGILTERDILKAFVKGMKPDTFVEDVMSKNVITIDKNATLEEAARRMLDHGIKRLPVVSKGRCVGLVTATDLITYEERLIDKMSELLLLPRRKAEGG